MCRKGTEGILLGRSNSRAWVRGQYPDRCQRLQPIIFFAAGTESAMGSFVVLWGGEPLTVAFRETAARQEIRHAGQLKEAQKQTRQR